LINLTEELKNGPCKHYQLFNAHVRRGDNCRESQDRTLKTLATCNKQTLDAIKSTSDKIVLINRLPVVFSGSPLCVDIVTEIKQFIFKRFKIIPPFTYQFEPLEMEKTFKTHIKTTVDHYTTYFLIDSVKNSEYYIGEDLLEMEPAALCPRIVSLMVLEKDVRVMDEDPACLIHYLCTYPSMQGKGYATKILKMVFDQEYLSKKVVYAVTKLPPQHTTNLGKIDKEHNDVQIPARLKLMLKHNTENDSKEFFRKFYFEEFKNGGRKEVGADIVDQCQDLIYEGSEHMRCNQVSIAETGICPNNSTLYEIDNNVKYSLTYDKDRVLYAKNPHYG